MTKETMLEMLKVDLGISTEAYDERLKQYLEDAAEEIKREGITLSDTVGDGNLQIMYAAWLWRCRKDGDGMPRMLRYRMNNRLFSEKMRTTPNGGSNDDEEES